MAKTEKKVKSNGLPAVGENAFNSEENREAGEKYWAKLKDTLDEDSLKAFLKFATWSRDAVGWRSFGRIITTGKAER